MYDVYITLPSYRGDAFRLAHGPYAGSHLRPVDRYHNLGTTMTVETKSPAKQIDDDHLLPDQENDEDEEVELTPSSGMLCARPSLFVWSLIAARFADLKGKQRSGKRRKSRRRKRRTHRLTLHGSGCQNCSQVGNIRRERFANTGMSELRPVVHTRPRGV